MVNHVSFLDSQIVQAFLQLLLLLRHRLRLFQISGQLHLQISMIVVLSNRTSILRELSHESAINIIVFVPSSRCWRCLFGLLLGGLCCWSICNLLLKVFDLLLELLILALIIKAHHHLIHLVLLLHIVGCKDKSSLKLVLLLLVVALIHVCLSDRHLILHHLVDFFLQSHLWLIGSSFLNSDLSLCLLMSLILLLFALLGFLELCP